MSAHYPDKLRMVLSLIQIDRVGRHNSIGEPSKETLPNWGTAAVSVDATRQNYEIRGNTIRQRCIIRMLLCFFFSQASFSALQAHASYPLDKQSSLTNLPTENRQPPGVPMRAARLGRRSPAPTLVVKRRIPRTRKGPKKRRPDVIYYPTPEETVAEMLRLANIRHGDVLYDLGSGDGRIPIMAAQQYGIRAIGIEIDPKLVAMARERSQRAKVATLVSFRNDDMFRTNVSEATVVTLYLSNRLNLLLRPKLLRELRPGTRILSHDFHMGDWRPEQKIKVPWQSNLYRTVYLWIVPARDPPAKKR